MKWIFFREFSEMFFSFFHDDRIGIAYQRTWFQTGTNTNTWPVITLLLFLLRKRQIFYESWEINSLCLWIVSCHRNGSRGGGGASFCVGMEVGGGSVCVGVGFRSRGRAYFTHYLLLILEVSVPRQQIRTCFRAVMFELERCQMDSSCVKGKALFPLYKIQGLCCPSKNET